MELRERENGTYQLWEDGQQLEGGVSWDRHEKRWIGAAPCSWTGELKYVVGEEYGTLKAILEQLYVARWGSYGRYENGVAREASHG